MKKKLKHFSLSKNTYTLLHFEQGLQPTLLITAHKIAALSNMESTKDEKKGFFGSTEISGPTAKFYYEMFYHKTRLFYYTRQQVFLPVQF